MTAPTPIPVAPIHTESIKREKYYRPELDAVRFFAFFLVFLHHDINHNVPETGPHLLLARMAASFSNGCGFGLGLFFALSAYLICELLLREKERTSTIALKSFYVRRVLRIWPLYFLGLSIGCVLALIHHQTFELLLFGSYALMVGNWFILLSHFTLNPMGILWSISVEEQFYLFCPLTVRQLSRKGLYALCAVLVVAANVTLFHLGSLHEDTDIAVWCNGLVQFEFFAAGILVCLSMHGKRPTLPVWVRLALQGIAVVCFFIACFVFHAKQPAPADSGISLVLGYGLAAIGCVLVIYGALGFPAHLLPKWMIWLGKVSFGLYVYHGLAIDLVSYLPDAVMGKGILPFLIRSVLRLGLAILMAGISYRYFETPFLRLKKRFEMVESRPV